MVRSDWLAAGAERLEDVCLGRSFVRKRFVAAVITIDPVCVTVV